jgi:uncharacterized membrane protein YoaK (UPF0700 family)
VHAQSDNAEPIAPSAGNSPANARLPFLLSIVAGSMDVISFLALNGLFTAHITGDIVVLAARIVAGDQAPVSHLLAIPVFMLFLGLTRLLATWLERSRIPSLLPLLLLELLLISGFLAMTLAAGPLIDPNAPKMVCAGMLGVAAMAVQNALVRISLTGVPSTAVMTTNVTNFVLDIGEVFLALDAGHVTKARERARQSGVAIAGFFIGCALGAAAENIVGLRSLALPIGVLLVGTFGLMAALPPSRS